MNLDAEAKDFNDSIIIFKNAFATNTLRSIGYYSIINFEQFKSSRELVNRYFNQLLSEDFARVQSSHMNEGIFGSEVWTYKMNYSKMMVISNLVTCITAGYRLLNCISGIRAIERNNQAGWKNIKKNISSLVDDFRLCRNALEHIDNEIKRGLAEDIDSLWRFNKAAVFEYDLKGKIHRFDFSTNASSPIEMLRTLYFDFIQMLRERSF